MGNAGDELPLLACSDRYTHLTPRVWITGISGRPYPPESGGSLVRHVLPANKRGGSLAFMVGNGSTEPHGLGTPRRPGIRLASLLP